MHSNFIFLSTLARLWIFVLFGNFSSSKPVKQKAQKLFFSRRYILFWTQSRKNEFYFSLPFVVYCKFCFYFRFLKIADEEKCIHTRSLSFFCLFANHYRRERNFLFFLCRAESLTRRQMSFFLRTQYASIITDHKKPSSSDRSERFWKYFWFFFLSSATDDDVSKRVQATPRHEKY